MCFYEKSITLFLNKKIRNEHLQKAHYVLLIFFDFLYIEYYKIFNKNL